MAPHENPFAGVAIPHAGDELLVYDRRTMPLRSPPKLLVLTLAMCLVPATLAGCGDDGTGGATGGGMGGGTGPNPTDTWPEASAALEAEVVALVNARRAEGATCGSSVYGPASPLTVDALLEEAARLHTSDMVERDFFSHTNPDGDGVGDRVDAVGYQWSAVAENIAAGQLTAAAVMATWMSSPGHCANIMDPDLEEIGVGTLDGVWTQVFGTPL